MDASIRGEIGGATVRPRFHGRAGAMFPVVLKGVALTFLTLGVYRFWYVTHVRRFLWDNTEVDGDQLEYTGRGVELFIGFLIALAVLIPFYGVLFLVGLAAGPIGAVIVQWASTLGILILAQYALFRARRYRLTRTVWRGVRWQQSGSGWAYAARSLGWGVASLLTLGLAYPWMRASLERYKMTNTWYGDQQGAFSATGGQLFKRGVALWALSIVMVGAILLGGALVAERYEASATGALSGGAYALQALPVLGLLSFVVIVPVYLALEFRWWAEGCAVGPASARCDLGLLAFFKVYAGYAGIVLLFAVAVGAAAVLAGYLLKTGGVFEAREAGPAQIALMVSGVLAYVAVALIFAALWQLFVIRPIWRKSFESVEIAGLSALTAAQSQTPPANAFGEGVADAIDFGGF